MVGAFLIRTVSNYIALADPLSISGRPGGGGRGASAATMQREMGLFERVKEEVKRRGLLEMGDHVLVAVSGGPDSMCLLYCLWWLRRDYGLKLTIAHLDHGIR
ncbi:hypothetical protein DRJ27_02220, partial [Candidatus Acetothermia bacterium]